MLAPKVMTAQQSGLAFYYNRRDQGSISEHQHDAHQITVTIGGRPNVRWRSATHGEEHFTAGDGNIIVSPAREPHRVHWEGAW